MSKLIDYQLSSEATEYIKQNISDLGLSLSRMAKKYIDLNKGKVMGILPLDIERQQVIEFGNGGLEYEPSLPQTTVLTNEKVHGKQSEIRLGETTLRLIMYIQEHLKVNKDHLCIMEDMSAEPSFPFLKYSLSNIKFYQNEVYSVIYNDEVQVQQIWNAIRDTRSAACHIGLMTSYPENTHILKKTNNLTEDELIILAQRTEKIFVGAYDMESYLIWSKRS